MTFATDTAASHDIGHVLDFAKERTLQIVNVTFSSPSC